MTMITTCINLIEYNFIVETESQNSNKPSAKPMKWTLGGTPQGPEMPDYNGLPVHPLVPVYKLSPEIAHIEPPL